MVGWLVVFVVRAGAFCPHGSGAVFSPTLRTRVLPRANEYDVWWQQRRERSIIHNPNQARVPSEAPGTLELNVDNVALVLSEFVRSDYARSVFNNARVDGTDYGRIGGMFESVRLANTTLVVKLKRVFEERNTALLERVSRYLRARIPTLKGFHAVHREGVDIF